MAKKENTPAKQESTATMEVALPNGEEYTLLKKTPEQISDVIEVNLAGSDIGVFDLERVRIPDGKSDFWTLPTVDGTEAVKTIEGVIVYRQHMRAMWFGKDIDNSPPDCSSKDGDVGYGIRERGQDRQLDRSPQECNECPLAAYGSAEGDAAGQACKATCAVFLLQGDSILPILLMLPPTSLKAIKKYALALSRIDQSYFTVVTSIGLEKAKNPAGQDYNIATFSIAKAEDGSRKTFPPAGVERLRSYHLMIKELFGTPAKL